MIAKVELWIEMDFLGEKNGRIFWISGAVVSSQKPAWFLNIVRFNSSNLFRKFNDNNNVHNAKRQNLKITNIERRVFKENVMNQFLDQKN